MSSPLSVHNAPTFFFFLLFSLSPDTTYVPSSDVERERFEEVKKQTFAHALSWSEEEGAETYVGGAANRVVSCRPLPTIPVYVRSCCLLTVRAPSASPCRTQHTPSSISRSRTPMGCWHTSTGRRRRCATRSTPRSEGLRTTYVHPRIAEGVRCGCSKCGGTGLPKTEQEGRIASESDGTQMTHDCTQ